MESRHFFIQLEAYRPASQSLHHYLTVLLLVIAWQKLKCGSNKLFDPPTSSLYSKVLLQAGINNSKLNTTVFRRQWQTTCKVHFQSSLNLGYKACEILLKPVKLTFQTRGIYLYIVVRNKTIATKGIVVTTLTQCCKQSNYYVYGQRQILNVVYKQGNRHTVAQGANMQMQKKSWQGFAIPIEHSICLQPARVSKNMLHLCESKRWSPGPLGGRGVCGWVVATAASTPPVIVGASMVGGVTHHPGMNSTTCSPHAEEEDCRAWGGILHSPKCSS